MLYTAKLVEIISVKNEFTEIPKVSTGICFRKIALINYKHFTLFHSFSKNLSEMSSDRWLLGKTSQGEYMNVQGDLYAVYLPNVYIIISPQWPQQFAVSQLKHIVCLYCTLLAVIHTVMKKFLS